MASDSSGLFRLWAKTALHSRPINRLATLAVAGAVAIIASAAAAAPLEVALVESLTSNSPGVEFMDYVQAGQIIRLGAHETIVLSYMTSCVRETITGGTVTVGTDWSEVQSGEVRRARGQCDTGTMVLTGAQSHIGGRTFRGPTQ
jgi:energy-converting hydrogenase Eha subunit C